MSAVASSCVYWCGPLDSRPSPRAGAPAAARLPCAISPLALAAPTGGRDATDAGAAQVQAQVGDPQQADLQVATQPQAAEGRIATVERFVRSVPRRARVLLLLLAALGAAAAAWSPAIGAQSVDELRQRAQSKRDSERQLSSDVARLGRLMRRLQADIALVERRRTEVQAELAQDQAHLAEVRGALRAQRARVQRLRRRLHQTQGVLARRLIELYKTPDADLLSVIVDARDFADLLDSAAFLQRIASQDRRIILNVRRARTDAADAVRQLAASERRQQQTTEAVGARSRALAGISASLASRRADLAAAQAARRAALSRTRTDRRGLEQRIAKLEARRANYTGASSGGPWAIPWPIVQCESGGQNLPPNSAGASGYYQIMPATWQGAGGNGPAAYLAPKAEQDRVAAIIWNGGSGASNWVCAGLVAAG